MGAKPDNPIASPIVPILRGVIRLSTIWTPILTWNRSSRSLRSRSAVRSGFFGHRATVPGGEFFWSMPAFGVSIPRLIVKMKPLMPPRMVSDSEIMTCASLESIFHLAAMFRASFEGRIC